MAWSNNFVMKKVVVLFAGLADAAHRTENQDTYSQRDENRRQIVAYSR